ncbi:MAG: hypothetical protein L0H80_08005, partial [Propionibacterium sp.]|nr:hypothetical protein [Propionibacterium sp.]
MRIADMDAILITTEKDPNLANPPKGFGRSNYESALCNPSRRNESSMTFLWTKRGGAGGAGPGAPGRLLPNRVGA